jgi:hypothetical protein
MWSQELDLIHAAVAAAGHPWAWMTLLESLQAKEAVDALVEDERESALEATQNYFNEVAELLDQAEEQADLADHHLELSEGEMEEEAEDVPQAMELDLQ